MLVQQMELPTLAAEPPRVAESLSATTASATRASRPSKPVGRSERSRPVFAPHQPRERPISRGVTFHYEPGRVPSSLHWRLYLTAEAFYLVREGRQRRSLMSARPI